MICLATTARSRLRKSLRNLPRQNPLRLNQPQRNQFLLSQFLPNRPLKNLPSQRRLSQPSPPKMILSPRLLKSPPNCLPVRHQPRRSSQRHPPRTILLLPLPRSLRKPLR